MPPRRVVKGASNTNMPGAAGGTGRYRKSSVPTTTAGIRTGRRHYKKHSGTPVKVTRKRSPR